MAKTNTVLIKLVSSADTGVYYVTKKNPRTKTGKLELKKFDPVARKHVVFKEATRADAPLTHQCLCLRQQLGSDGSDAPRPQSDGGRVG